MTDSIAGERRLRKSDVALLLLASVPLFVNLGWMPAWSSEQRWLSIAREMRASGNWAEPNLEGEFYGDKPLLSYWMIVIASWLTGGVNELAGRLPSAIAGLVTVCLTGWIAARLRGRSVAVLAGFVVATAFSFQHWSRSAEADLLNAAFCTGAIAVHVAARERFAPWQPFAFAALLGLGGQAKGIPAIVLPCAVALADMAITRSPGLLRRPAWAAAGALLGGALYFAPFALSYLQRHDWRLLDLMWRENFVRAVDSFDHDDSGPLYYAYTLPAMLVPWTLGLPGALAWAVARVRRDSGLRFALLAFAVIFAAFTVSSSRRSYYILPIFPFCGVLIAGFWDDVLRLRPAAAWRVIAWAPLGLLVAVAWLAAVYLLVGRWIPGAIAGHPIAEAAQLVPHGPLLGVALALAGAAAVLAWRGGNARGAVAGVVSIAFVACLYRSTGGDELQARGLVERDFARSVLAISGGRETVSYRMGASRLRYYLGPGRSVSTPEDVGKLVEASAPLGVLLVCEPGFWPELEQSPLLSSRVALRATSPAFGSFAPERDRYVLVECRPR